MNPYQNWKSLSFLYKIIVLVVLVYALAGFFLTTIFFAIRLHLTDDPGAVNFNDRKFEEAVGNTGQPSDSTLSNEAWFDVLERLRIMNEYFPYDAGNMLKVLATEQDILLTERMLLSADLYLQNDHRYQEALAHKENWRDKRNRIKSDTSLYHWINTLEWKTLRVALQKQAKPLDSVAKSTGVTSRLLACMLIGEQIRLFDSKREAFKKWISPLKILVNETKISLGVMGIKEETAIKIENYLKDKESIYYLGPEFEHRLDFKTSDVTKERFDRLTNPVDHTYPYLYAAIFLRQVMHQWQCSGFDISDKPGILATLFNLGFIVSVPKADPQIGGSRVKIQEKEYTFGSLAWEFYYSGELNREFPYSNRD